MTPAIRIQQLGKRHRIQRGRACGEYRTLCETLTHTLAAPWRWWRQDERCRSYEDFWALKDITFDVGRGEVVGVIGRNGAGKSTLLKILSRITRPTEGSVEINGRVGSLLEVGTGFHPELTGRENIFLNGGVLGMRRREIQLKFDEIVAFAGVERFLDMPVKRYSSGMYIRLAFAVAAHLDPEILLVDEVLAVGDLAFQAKCLDRMGEVASEGRTVIFVSHNMPAIEALCNRAVLLEQGQMLSQGSTSAVVERYVQTVSADGTSSQRAIIDLSRHHQRSRSSRAIMQKLRVLDADNLATTDLPLGAGVTFELTYENSQQLAGLNFAVFLCSDSGQRLAMLHSHVQDQLAVSDQPNGVVRCHIPELPLLPGIYRIDLSAGTWCEMLDYIEHATTITILPTDYLGTGRLPTTKQGLLALRAQWSQAATEAQPCVQY